MIININEEYRIQSDPHQWTVQRLPKKTEKQTKEPQWTSMGHFQKLDSAIVWLAQRRIMMLPGEYDATALPALCAALDAIVADTVKARAA